MELIYCDRIWDCNCVREERWELFWKGRDVTFPGMMKMSYILTGLWVKKTYLFFKTHQTVQLISIHFTACKLCLKKDNVKQGNREKERAIFKVVLKIVKGWKRNFLHCCTNSGFRR